MRSTATVDVKEVARRAIHEVGYGDETCGDCHSESFAKAELAKGDDLIREADHLLAEAIRVIADLYGADMRLVRHDHRCSEEGHHRP